MPILNPFLYGKPVPPKRLIGRHEAVRTVYARLYNGESSAIVGEPHIGKTSVLQYITDESVRRTQLAEQFDRYRFVEIDCHLLASDFKPGDFWRQLLDEIKDVTADEAIKDQYHIVVQNNFGTFTLESFFKLLSANQWHIVLLIDEFEVLLDHPNFNKAEFLGALRSFAMRTDALIVITASRVSVAELNRRSQEINPHGSPFFNNMTEVRLLPLSLKEAQLLIDSALQQGKGAVTFSPADYDFLFSVAGRHPYLLQMAAASLYDALSDSEDGARYSQAMRIFQDRSDAHFQDFWRHLVPTEQRALLLLALAQYRGFVDGRSFDLEQIGKLEWYAPDLRHLRDLGIVESVTPDTPGSISWLGENWRIAANGIIPWLMDTIVAGSRDATDFDKWLKDKEFQGLLTNEESAKLREVGREVSKGAVSLAGDFVRTVLFKKI